MVEEMKGISLENIHFAHGSLLTALIEHLTSYEIDCLSEVRVYLILTNLQSISKIMLFLFLDSYCY